MCLMTISLMISYTVHRYDRNFAANNLTRGGGVLVALKNHYNSKKLDLSLLHNCLPFTDIVGCSCVFNNVLLFIFVVYIYHPMHLLMIMKY